MGGLARDEPRDEQDEAIFSLTNCGNILLVSDIYDHATLH
jgi:hypothetical protein